MPILDYAKSAESAYKSIINDEQISDTNKEYAKKFDKVYKIQVRPATRAKFWRHLKFFLRETDDCKTLFDNPDAVNELFAKLHKELGVSYYITIINVTNRFVKWLNDDVKPRGFKDVKSPKKSLQRRKLNKSDMWEWEDGVNVGKQTTSAQVKAMIMTQLNLGARPSEFIDLRYGDIETKGKFMVVHIRDGKTGGREAILFYAVPYLARWLNEHPSKKKDAPLWLVENAKNSHVKDEQGNFKQGKQGQIIQANYATLKKRLEYLVRKAGLSKRTDFYTLRHSCARLLRLWGVPVEECAKQLGHSVKEFTETYGRLDTSDREARHAKALGVSTDVKDAKPQEPVACPKCEQVNPPEKEQCSRCGSPMTLKKALAEKDDTKQMIISVVAEALREERAKE